MRATVFIDITEVDGRAPTQVLNSIGLMSFTPSDGEWDLLNDGPGPFVDGTWMGTYTLDVEQFLIDNDEPFIRGATQVKFAMDNLLTTLSESGTSATIGKKDFDGLAVTVIPEPTTGALLALGLAGLAMRGHRSR